MTDPRVVATVVVVKDFDGFFEKRVRDILSMLDEDERSAYRVIRIKATPYLPDAVQYEIRDDELTLTFYSGLRNGFGTLNWSLVIDLIRGSRKIAPS
jgi:hypothetical protein